MALSPHLLLLHCMPHSPRTPSHPRTQGCSLGEHTQVSPPILTSTGSLTPPWGTPWGTLGSLSPAQLHPCLAQPPGHYPMILGYLDPALGHPPHPIGCRLSSHLQYQCCSFTSFHLGPHPSGFHLLAPSGHEILPECTPGHTSVQSLIQGPFLSLVIDLSEPPGSVPPHDPLCPIPLSSSLLWYSVL